MTLAAADRRECLSTLLVTRRASAVLRHEVTYSHDGEIVRYLERFGEEPPVPSRAHDDTPEAVPGGHAVGTPTDPAAVSDDPQARDQDFSGGDDGTRTHDPLLAKERTGVSATCTFSRKCWSRPLSRAGSCCRVRPDAVSLGHA